MKAPRMWCGYHHLNCGKWGICTVSNAIFSKSYTSNIYYHHQYPLLISSEYMGKRVNCTTMDRNADDRAEWVGA